MGRVENVARQISQQISVGVYRSGQRLPSVRQAAKDHGLSKNSMAEVYDRLVAKGVLAARQGSGYYVTESLAVEYVPTVPHVQEAIDIVSLLREQLDQHYEVRPGDGRPPASWMEGSEIGRHFQTANKKAQAIEFGYGSSWGHGPLRDWLRMSLRERSIETEPDGILLTHGINHSLDLVIRHLLEPGDTVFVDNPGYYPLFGKLKLANVNIVPVNRNADGPDIDDLAIKLSAHTPKVFFTQSQAHNPTGGSLSPAVAFGLLQLSERWGFYIVEDDVFADMVSPSLPRLAAFGQRERVLYAGSFSKTLSASLRSGYIAGHPPIIRHLANIKMLTTVATSAYVEQLILELILSGQYLKHLRRLRTRMEDATRACLASFADIGIEVDAPKVPGFYLWVNLTSVLDEALFCRAAAEKSIFIAPAQVFNADRAKAMPPGMRVNVAYGADERFLSFLRQQLS